MTAVIDEVTVERPEPPDVARARARLAELDAEIAAHEAAIATSESAVNAAKVRVEQASAFGQREALWTAETAVLDREQAIEDTRKAIRRLQPERAGLAGLVADWDADERARQRLAEEIAGYRALAEVDRRYVEMCEAIDGYRRIGPGAPGLPYYLKDVERKRLSQSRSNLAYQLSMLHHRVQHLAEWTARSTKGGR